MWDAVMGWVMPIEVGTMINPSCRELKGLDAESRWPLFAIICLPQKCNTEKKKREKRRKKTEQSSTKLEVISELIHKARYLVEHRRCTFVVE